MMCVEKLAPVNSTRGAAQLTTIETIVPKDWTGRRLNPCARRLAYVVAVR